MWGSSPQRVWDVQQGWGRLQNGRKVEKWMQKNVWGLYSRWVFESFFFYFIEAKQKKAHAYTHLHKTMLQWNNFKVKFPIFFVVLTFYGFFEQFHVPSVRIIVTAQPHCGKHCQISEILSVDWSCKLLVMSSANPTWILRKRMFGSRKVLL